MHKLLSQDELAPYYTIPDVSFWQMGTFALSRGWNRYQSTKENGWEPSSYMTSQIILGRIPDNSNELNLPPDVTLVVSLTTYEELAGRGVNWLGTTIVTPVEWKQKNIEHVFVHMPDFTANVSCTAVLNAVMRMRYHIERGGIVYLHCKAGRARSAMVLLVYLMIFGDSELSLEPNQPLLDILKLIREKRAQITVGADKQEKALKILAAYHSDPNAMPKKNHDNLQGYLISPEGKNDICRLNAFKELAIYVTRIQGYSKNQIVDLIRAFFKEILLSKDGSWYHTLNVGHGPLIVFSLPREHETETNNRERTRLVAQFIEELETLLVSKELIPASSVTLSML